MFLWDLQFIKKEKRKQKYTQQEDQSLNYI